MYRDDERARQDRVTTLEDRVTSQATEIAALRDQLARRDRRLRALMARFDGAAAAPRRVWLLVALVGAGLVGGVALGLAIGAGRQRAHPPEAVVAAEDSILADPADRRPTPKKAPKPVDQVTEHAAEHAADERSPGRCEPGDPFCGASPERFDETAQKRHLLNAALAGEASEVELRMLKAICMNDGDRDCRDLAVAKLAAVTSR